MTSIAKRLELVLVCLLPALTGCILSLEPTQATEHFTGPLTGTCTSGSQPGGLLFIANEQLRAGQVAYQPVLVLRSFVGPGAYEVGSWGAANTVELRTGGDNLWYSTSGRVVVEASTSDRVSGFIDIQLKHAEDRDRQGSLSGTWSCSIGAP